MLAGLKPYLRMKDSGVEWLGEVPAHWDVSALRHRYSQCLGKMLDTSKIKGNHLVPYLRNVDVQWDRINVNDLPTMDIAPAEYERYTVRKGDLLVCEGGEVGRCAIWGNRLEVCGFQKALHRLRPHDARRDLVRYLYHAFRVAVEREAFNDGHQSTIAHLTGEKLRVHRFPFPSTSEQTAIARFLDYMDRRFQKFICSKEKLIALLREQRLTATVETMRRPNAPKLRLGVVTELVKRPVSRVDVDTYTPIGLYNRGRGIFKKEARLGINLGDSDFFWVEEGDLVISGQFAWEGAVALAGKSEHGCVATHRYPIVRGKEGVLDTGYLLSFFQTDWGQLLLDHHSRGAAGRNRPLNTRTLTIEKIPVPSLDDQTTIADLLHQETRVRLHVQRWKELIDEFRTRLIDDVVTGKLDVREAAAELPELNATA